MGCWVQAGTLPTCFLPASPPISSYTCQAGMYFRQQTEFLGMDRTWNCRLACAGLVKLKGRGAKCTYLLPLD